MKFLWLSAAIFLMSATAFSQGWNGNKLYEAEGNILIFRVVPAEKSAKIYLLGKKAGEVRVGRDARLLTVSTKMGKKSEELNFRNDGSFYEITLPSDVSSDLDLTFKAEVRGKPDGATIRIKKP